MVPRIRAPPNGAPLSLKLDIDTVDLRMGCTGQLRNKLPRRYRT
jgi:hypothetical protein